MHEIDTLLPLLLCDKSTKNKTEQFINLIRDYRAYLLYLLRGRKTILIPIWKSTRDFKDPRALMT